MKTKKLLLKITLFFSFFILHFSFSYGQSWLWGKEGDGLYLNSFYGSSVATDQTGNAYITGNFSTVAIFGTIKLTSYTNSTYLTKYDASGNVIWAVQSADSGTSFSAGVSVATDEADNIYITGTFTGTTTFGSYMLRAKRENAFLVKYNANGNVLWAIQSASSPTSFTRAFSVATDRYNNTFVTGYFWDTASFGGDTLIGPGGECPFVVKYSPSGNLLWERQGVIPYDNCLGIAYSVTADKEGNAYITGTFLNTISWGSYQLVSPANSSSFLVKYSPSGTVLWAKQSVNKGSLAANNAYANAVVTDQANNPYITGYFSDSVKFGSHLLYSIPGGNHISSAFLTKYDTNGNAIWAEQSSLGMDGTSLASDKVANIYLGGSIQNNFSDSIFSFGGYSLHANSQATNSAFLLRFDTGGTAVCGSTLANIGYAQNVGYTENLGIASDSGTAPGNYVYMAGVFSETTVICGPDTLSSSSSNVWVGKWLNCAQDAGVNGLQATSEEMNVYPNPSNGKFTVSISHPELVSVSQTIEVYNMLGEKVYCETLKQVQGDNSINLSNQPNGVYLYRVITETGDLVGEGKLVVQR